MRVRKYMEMLHINKLLRFEMVLLMLICLCVGCGNQGGEETGGTTQEVSQPPAEDAPAESTPTEDAPAESTPTEDAPAESAPTESESLSDTMGNLYNVVLEPEGCVIESDYLRIELPESWEGKFLYAVSEDRTITLYHRASYEYFRENLSEDHIDTLDDMGVIGWVEYAELEYAESMVDAVSAVIFGEPEETGDGTFVYMLQTPTDVRYPLIEEISQEYYQLNWPPERENITDYITIK